MKKGSVIVTFMQHYTVPDLLHARVHFLRPESQKAWWFPDWQYCGQSYQSSHKGRIVITIMENLYTKFGFERTRHCRLIISQFFSVWPLLTSGDLWPIPKTIGIIYLRSPCMVNVTKYHLVQPGIVDLSCSQWWISPNSHFWQKVTTDPHQNQQVSCTHYGKATHKIWNGSDQAL